MAMAGERVLIIGAGISGSILAYWLARYGFHVTVIERSRVEQKLGQGLEIEFPALDVVKAMDGVLERLRARRTGELGIQVVDAQLRSYGTLGAGAMSPVGALEIMRGDLADVLYKAADESPNVSYRFGTVMESLRQNGEKVFVTLKERSAANSTSKEEEYDFVVGADGARSRTRQLIMGPPQEIGCYNPIDVCVAYFSIAKEARDWPYSTLCHFPGRRVVWLRPVGKDATMTSAYLLYLNPSGAGFRERIASGDRAKQKEAFAEAYSGLGGEIPRVIEEMMKSENFYADDLAQVKLSTWSKDRVALLGDSAWAPTPLTGEGNQLAILGAFVLAQEMNRDRSPKAFAQYENRFRAYVESAQRIPLNGKAPLLFLPQTTFGIWIFRAFYTLLASAVNFAIWTGVTNYFPEERPHEPFDLQLGDEKAAL